MNEPVDPVPTYTADQLAKLVQVALLNLVAERRQKAAADLRRAQQLALNAELANRPCLVLAPYIVQRDGKWEAHRGDLVGRGATPDAALEDFDHVYTNGESRS